MCFVIIFFLFFCSFSVKKYSDSWMSIKRKSCVPGWCVCVWVCGFFHLFVVEIFSWYRPVLAWQPASYICHSFLWVPAIWTLSCRTIYDGMEKKNTHNNINQHNLCYFCHCVAAVAAAASAAFNLSFFCRFNSLKCFGERERAQLFHYIRHFNIFSFVQADLSRSRSILTFFWI